MTTFSQMNGKLREGRGKGPNRRLRRQGLLPAVLYGQDANLSFFINPIELTRVLEKSGINTLIDLSIEGDSLPKRTVLLKEAQMHSFKDQWLHADFFEVNLKEKLKVHVPIKLVGHSPAEKLGGIVEFHLHELEIKCLPGDIPDRIEVNMETVEMDQVVHVSDLTVPETAEVLEDPETAVVAVHEVKVVEEKPEAELAEGELAPAEGEAQPAEGEEAKTEKKEEGN